MPNTIGGSLAKLVKTPKPFYSKKEIANLLNRSDFWIREWESKLMIDCGISDFKKFYSPNKGLNYYQACCLAMVSDYRSSFPSASNDDLIALIKENISEFTLASVMVATAPKKKTAIVKKEIQQ